MHTCAAFDGPAYQAIGSTRISDGTRIVRDSRTSCQPVDKAHAIKTLLLHSLLDTDTNWL